MKLSVMATMAAVLALTMQATSAPLRIVSSLDLNRYLGKWHEVARLPNRFQKQCVSDVVAEYGLRTDGRIDVLNTCRTGDGTTDEARGIARKAGDGSNNAVLQVRFAPAILSFLPMVWGDYWIIGLGPDYSWAVVGTPNRQFLWILSRTPTLSDAAYEQAIEVARGNGFDVISVIRSR
jgi:apolipoprotein D and lipocalin family protein